MTVRLRWTRARTRLPTLDPERVHVQPVRERGFSRQEQQVIEAAVRAGRVTRAAPPPPELTAAEAEAMARQADGARVRAQELRSARSRQAAMRRAARRAAARRET